MCERYEEVSAVEDFDKATATLMFSKALLHYKQHGLTKKDWIC